MKITQQELIEFADKNDLQVFGKSSVIISKIRAIQRLVNKELIPKPEWEGGKRVAYWENDTEIKDRVMWLDEQKKAGKSYKQMYKMLNSSIFVPDAIAEINPILKHIDSLLEIHPTNFDLSYMKAKLYEKIGCYDKALLIYNSVLSKEENDERFIALLYGSIINIYNIENKKEEEKRYCENYISFAQNKDDEILGDAYLQMVNYYLEVDPEISRQYYEKAEKLITSKEKLGKLYVSAYKTEMNVKNMEKAREHIQKALEIFSDNVVERAKCIANYSIIFFYEKDYDTALKYYLEAKEVFGHYKDILREATVAVNIGMIYRIKGDYDKALKVVRCAINNLNPETNPIEYKEALSQLSDIYSKMGNEKKSQFYEEEQKKIEVTYLER